MKNLKQSKKSGARKVMLKVSQDYTILYSTTLNYTTEPQEDSLTLAQKTNSSNETEQMTQK
jgi:hypothetical protein